MPKLWPTVAVSSAPSRSCPALTVTVCGRVQVVAVNASTIGETVTSALSLATSMDTEHPAGGAASSTTVYVPRWAFIPAPGASSSDRALADTVAPGVGVTGRVPVVSTPAPECAAAATCTASVAGTLKP